jgi:hypothetical protein
MILMPKSDCDDLDAVVRVLGIEDSHVTPAEAVAELHAEIERLRAGRAAVLDDDRLRAECAAIINERRGLIDAVKHVRAVRGIPLKEAAEWVRAINLPPAPPSFKELALPVLREAKLDVCFMRDRLRRQGNEQGAAFRDRLLAAIDALLREEDA